MSQARIQQEVVAAQDWFQVELGSNKPITGKIKVAISREIIKSGRDHDPKRIKIALLSLTLADEVVNPLAFTQADIDNALWLVRDNAFGYSNNPPIVQKYP